MIIGLRLWLSLLNEHRFNHNVNYCINPLCRCSLDIELTVHLFLHCNFYSSSPRPLFSSFSIRSAFCVCSTLVLYIPKTLLCLYYQETQLSLTYFQEKTSRVSVQIPFVLKLFNSVVISFSFSGFCSNPRFQLFQNQEKDFIFQLILLIEQLFLIDFILFSHLPANPRFYSALIYL